MIQKILAVLRRSPLAIVVLILGLGLTLAGWQYAAAKVDQVAHQQFLLHSDDAKAEILQRINTHIEILRGAHGLFAASEHITRSEWARFVEALDLRRYPGIQGMGFIRYVTGPERRSFERMVRGDNSVEPGGYPGFAIFPQGERDDYYPVTYFESLEPGLKVLGLDHGAYSVGREALERARDTGLPIASARLESVVDHTGKPRFMIVLPVYRNGQPHATVPERRSALLGFIYARFRMDELLNHTLGATLLQELHFEVYDGGLKGAGLAAPQIERLFYDEDGESVPHALRADFQPRFSGLSRMEVAGREWIIYFSTRSGSPLGTPEPTQTMILASGTMLSFALFMVVLIFSAEHKRVKNEVGKQKTLTSQVLDALPINIFLKDMDGRFVLINEHCARLLGVSKETAIGKSDFDLFPPEIARGLRAYDEDVHAASGLVIREERLVSEGREMFTFAGKGMIAPPNGEQPLLLGFSIDITERKNAEKALRDSEERLRGIIDNSTAVIFVKDLEGRYLLSNREHARQVGIDSAEIAGKTDYDCFPMDLADTYRENDRQVLASGKAIEFEEHVQQNDRLHSYVSVKFPLHDAIGEIYAVCGISTDITERLRLEREAAKAHANQLSRALTDAVGEGLIGVDLWHQVVFANPRAQELLGVGEAEILGRKLDEVVRAVTAEGDSLIDATCPAWEEIAKGCLFQTDDWSLERANGERFPASVLLSPIFDNGYVTGSVLSFQDITLRKQTEAALVMAERQQKAFLDNLPELAWFKDKDSRYIMVNETVGKICGVEPDKIVGMTDLDLFPYEIAEMYRADDREIMTSGKRKRVEEPLEGKNGVRIWIETIKSPIYDEHGEVVGTVGTARDISTRKQAEEELKRHAAELARINAELDEFTYVASHDLQEPLRKLIAFSDWLKRDLGDDLPPRAAKDVEFITDAANRMQSLVQDLLKLSRTGKTSMVREWLDLDDMVDRALDALALRIQETGTQIVRVPLPQVRGDPTLLAQLYQNLIGNAIKFVDHVKPHIQLTVEHLNGEWIFGVKDNGIGIKPEYAGQIFQPFKRLHGRGEYEGSGIGLAVCRKVIDRHRGRIWVESEEGQGAHFKFVVQARANQP